MIKRNAYEQLPDHTPVGNSLRNQVHHNASQTQDTFKILVVGDESVGESNCNITDPVLRHMVINESVRY